MLSSIHFSAASSGPQWTDIGNFAAQLVAVAVALIIGLLQLRRPKPRLLYSIRGIRSLKPLLVGGLLQAHSSAGPVSDPYVMYLVLDCRVPGGIDKQHYDDDKPISFDIGNPIQATAGVTKPKEQQFPKGSFKGNIFEIPPSYLMNGQVITYTLTLNGKPKVRAMSPFHSIRMRKARLDVFRTPFLGFTALFLGLILMLALPPASGVIVGSLLHQNISLAVEFFLGACGFIAGVLFLLGNRRRP